MDGAVWGALGAAAGAGATALGGYLGPVRAARAAAREQAEDRRERNRNQAVGRLIALRAAYRNWDEYLHEVARATAGGYRRESANEVFDHIRALRSAVVVASDAAMVDGRWIGSERKSFDQAASAVRTQIARNGPAPARELDEMRRAHRNWDAEFLGWLEEVFDGTDIPIRRH